MRPLHQLHSLLMFTAQSMFYRDVTNAALMEHGACSLCIHIQDSLPQIDFILLLNKFRNVYRWIGHSIRAIGQSYFLHSPSSTFTRSNRSILNIPQLPPYIRQSSFSCAPTLLSHTISWHCRAVVGLVLDQLIALIALQPY